MYSGCRYFDTHFLSSFSFTTNGEKASLIALALGDEEDAESFEAEDRVVQL